ncbi:protein SMG6 [Mytilus galloprovincialis]|uniref:Protein SMG6 n=1 Tax=Mytilus galloprovincialis TaxID=29158 RepID=A0A8B6E0T3_MYTGA|nr:protein SMG6 [Mytilus galloprovincialis]
MDRLKIIKNHLLVKGREPCITTKLCSFDSSQDCLHLKSGLQKLGLTNVEVSSPPVNYEHYYRTLLTPEAVKFVADLVNTFDNDVEGIFQERQRRKLLLDSTGGLPDFSKKSAILHGNWKVRPVPQRLQCRHVDLGDVSPSNTSHFVESLKTTAQGMQEIAQDCLRIQKLQLFGDYLCGIEPPMLAYNVETKQYYSIALSVEETEEQKKPSLSAEEWSDDGDVIIESEEEIIHGGDDDHVKHLKKKKLQLKQIKQDQEKHKENIQKIIDKNRHHCIEVEIHPIFLVPDTNCFIDHLPGLKKLILSKKFTITVPLVVINELDGLAKGSKDGQNSTQQHANRVRKTSEESVQFLEAEFEKKNSHLKTQTSKGNILETIAFRSEESENGTGNNDDIILSSCLHYCKDKAREFMPKEKDGPVRLYRDVVLLTDDRNLRLKAHTHNVPVKDVPSFLHWSKVT